MSITLGGALAGLVRIRARLLPADKFLKYSWPGGKGRVEPVKLVVQPGMPTVVCAAGKPRRRRTCRARAA